jgi:hypothetical protein
MARRDSFDDGHGMDHHKLNNAAWVAAGAIYGGSMGGPLGAVAGAAWMHGVNQIFNKRREEKEEEDY